MNRVPFTWRKRADQVGRGLVSAGMRVHLRHKWGKEHPELSATIRTLNREASRERRRECNRRLHALNREARREYVKEWKQRNKAKVKQYDAKRRMLIGPADPAVAAYYEEMHSRSDHVCHLCELPITDGSMELDHVIPLARGGRHAPDNLKPSHRLCNTTKSARLPHELRSA